MPAALQASGGNTGPCSGQSGILMYNEIQSVLDQTVNHCDSDIPNSASCSGGGSSASTVLPVFDEDAGVKYIVWDDNQWVSYDDADTFNVKMNYAHDHCIGGSMIWSMDQDDDSYTALKGLYPDIDAENQGLTEKNDKCIISECNVSSCGAGYKQLAVLVHLEGRRRDTVQPKCTDLLSMTCRSDPPQHLLTSVVKGELDMDLIDFCQDRNMNCPPTCTDGQVKPFCCVEGAPFSEFNCLWHGTAPLCQDNACPIGHVLLTTDIQGDASQPCSGSGTRSYCCNVDGRNTEPIPFDDIFPDTVPEGSLTFQEEFDPDEGVEEGKTGSGSTSFLPNDQEENESAFGEVFIDSPNSASVSSLDLKTNWVITSCHPTSDQPQSVPMDCSKGFSNSECSHVMIGGAEHTIVKVPQNCGRGPYARIASLDIHPDQGVLSSYHQSKKPADEPVYLLKFDYDFAVIPDANGPIYMRADLTDMPGYWDSVVESPPERKRWLQERGLQERWWGTFKNWLSKMTQVEKDTSVSRNFHWSDTWTIFHKEVSCPGPPEFEALIDISLDGQASLNSRYGFYLQATVVPPAFQAAYLYFSADAKAHAQFTLKGEASVRYDSSSIQFAKFGFPGLYYPGLLTVGPTLVLSGYGKFLSFSVQQVSKPCFSDGRNVSFRAVYKQPRVHIPDCQLQLRKDALQTTPGTTLLGQFSTLS
ncbi:hypothetical protein MVEN_01991600 [Mycena venus]|uniref:GH18 domain-containing protein n=1 Tax=Mycena venus TaxID=2733690 RepID=A0A8H7CKB3_9AGAR|nr:hypothetical protein MVEN_01991600 [Mycena venus]